MKIHYPDIEFAPSSTVSATQIRQSTSTPKISTFSICCVLTSSEIQQPVDFTIIGAIRESLSLCNLLVSGLVSTDKS